MSMKRYLALVLSVIFVLSFALPCFSFASGDFAGGDGTADNPYLISTKQQLDNVRKNSDDLYFKLINDIVFTDSDFEEGGAFYNDGSGFLPIDGFGGKFDGNGFSIVNLKQNGKGEADYGGLFGETNRYKNVHIENLNLKDCSVKDFAYAGGIAGSISIGLIDNCTVSGEVSSFKSIGGILGSTDNQDQHHGAFKIRNCCNNAKVTLDTSKRNTEDRSESGIWLGGVIGSNSAYIYNCTNNGSLNAKVDDGEYYVSIGGIAAFVYPHYEHDPIRRCYNTGNLNINLGKGYKECYIGGIAGEGPVKECYNIGKITVEASEKNYICGAISGTFEEESAYNYYLKGTAKAPYGDVSKEDYAEAELTAEEMKSKASFVGFNFEMGWRMGDSNGYEYPVWINTNDGIVSLEGKGTKEEPYLISTPEDLRSIDEWYDGSLVSKTLYFEMTNDIVFDDADFEEGGKFYNGGNGFSPIGENDGSSGYFNGNGYSIVNMKQTGREKAAIFIGESFRISNLNAVNCVFEATYCAAGISIGGTAENCTSDSVIIAEGADSVYAAGVIACLDNFTNYTVKNCVNKSEVKAISGSAENNRAKIAYAGGIAVGGEYDIYNSYNAGNVSAKAEGGNAYAGGIAAGSNDGLIMNAYNMGKITAENNNAEKTLASGAICNNPETEMISVYYLDESAPSASSDGEDKGAVRCTCEEMSNAQTYKDFGMDAYWEMGNEDYPYPVLKQETDASVLFESGNGTKADPFMIATKKQLENISRVTYSESSSYYYKLANDIIFEESDFEEGGAFYNDGQGFLPIGRNAAFNGTFDGNGFKIEGLIQNITKSAFVNTGLFGSVNGGTIKNLTLEKSTVTVNNGARAVRTGGVAGYIYNGSLISNSNVSESIVQNIKGENFSYIGGIVGCADASVVENCNSLGEVIMKQGASSSEVGAGGIAGRLMSLSRMSNSLNTATVTIVPAESKSEYIGYSPMGGLCARTDESYIVNCFNQGKLVCEKQNGLMGSLVGYAYISLMTVNCAYLENGEEKAVGKTEYIIVAPPVYIMPAKDKIGGFYTDTVRALPEDEDGSIPAFTFNEADSNFGDVTGDMKVNSSDIAMVQRYVTGKGTVQGITKMLADINVDTQTNSRDIAQLQKIVAG